MDLTTARLEVRARLQELTADFWTDSEVDRAINEGVNRFCQEEKWPYLYTVYTGASLAAGETDLDLTEGVAYERHFNLMVTFDGDSRPRHVQRVGPAEGYKLRQTYYNPLSEPLAYYIASQTSQQDDGEYTTTVTFVPALTRDADIEYQYVRDPAALTAGNDTLDVPNEYAMGVCAYAAGHLFLKELQTSGKAEEQFALYRKSVDDARKQMRRVVLDEGFAWGRNQPEFGFTDEGTLLDMMIPPTLGP